MDLGSITKTAREACSGATNLDDHLHCYSTVAKHLFSFAKRTALLGLPLLIGTGGTGTNGIYSILWKIQPYIHTFIIV